MNNEMNALDRGRKVPESLNPEPEPALAGRHDAQVDGFAESLIEWACGRHCARPGPGRRTRQLCTVAALTALDGQTGPQLRVNIEHAFDAAAARKENPEAIRQMAPATGACLPRATG